MPSRNNAGGIYAALPRQVLVRTVSKYQHDVLFQTDDRFRMEVWHMARKPRKKETCDTARGYIQATSEVVARRLGLDPSRVRSVLERTALDAYSNPLPDPSAVTDTMEHGLEFRPILEVATAYLGPERALDLFESSDLKVLADRIDFTDLFGSSCTPPYSLDELAQVLKRYISFLHDNWNHLVRTGWPKTRFKGPNFLTVILSNLYATKDPESLDIKRHATGEVEYVFRWSKEHNSPDHAIMVRFGLIGGDPDYNKYFLPLTEVGEWVDYDDASVLQGLNLDDAIRLADLRPKMLEARLKVVTQLEESLRRRDTKSIWPKTLDILTEHILGEEADFLLQMDAFYYPHDFGQGDQCEAIGIPSGGLSDLLTLVGHCESELRYGLYSKPRGILDALMELDELGQPLLPQTYYEILGTPEQVIVDEAAGLFRTLKHQTSEFWVEYRERVNRSLEDEFREIVVTKQKVKRKLVGHYTPNLTEYAAYVNAYLDATGRPPEVNYGSIQVGTSASVDDGGSGTSGPINPKPDPRLQDVVPFRTPKGTPWEKVVIEFHHDETVLVKVGKLAANKTFNDMGFRDRRIRQYPKPDIIWEFLKILAVHEGRISLDDVASHKGTGMTKKHVSQLRKRIRSYFPIEGDPFEPYRSANAYVAKFKIKDLRDQSR